MNMEKLRVFSLPNILGDSRLQQAYFCFSLTFTLNIPFYKSETWIKSEVDDVLWPWGLVL